MKRKGNGMLAAPGPVLTKHSRAGCRVPLAARPTAQLLLKPAGDSVSASVALRGLALPCP
jgi:hypothetical protein